MLVVTPCVETVKLAEFAPAGIEIDFGTTAAELLEARFTTSPPSGATPDNPMTPELDAPPTSVGGESVRLARAAGIRMRLATCRLEPRVAVTVRVSDLATPRVVIGNVAELEPLGIATEAGTDASGPFEASETTIPETPTGCDKVTVPVITFPPFVFAGLIDKVATWSGTIVSVEVCDVPLKVAVIVKVCADATGGVITAKVAIPELFDTETLAGTMAALGFELVRVTRSPPTPGGPLKVTVPRTDPVEPPTIELGVITRFCTVAARIDSWAD